LWNLFSFYSVSVAGMKRGSFVISLTKRIPCPDFIVLEFELYRMSWGEATIFLCQKTTDPRPGTSHGDIEFGSGDNSVGSGKSKKKKASGNSKGDEDDEEEENDEDNENEED
jgi:hypothetical protein